MNKMAKTDMSIYTPLMKFLFLPGAIIYFWLMWSELFVLTLWVAIPNILFFVLLIVAAISLYKPGKYTRTLNIIFLGFMVLFQIGLIIYEFVTAGEFFPLRIGWLLFGGWFLYRWTTTTQRGFFTSSSLV